MDERQSSQDSPDGSLRSGGIEHAFSIGHRFNDQPMPLIPREEWPREIEAATAEEDAWWKGESVPVHLVVELPFWLMVADCEIKVAHSLATVTACVRGHFVEVSDGPLFRSSHANVTYVGPEGELSDGKEPPVVSASKAPVYRYMKTVVCFAPQAMNDAIDALKDVSSVTWEDRPAVRRVSRAEQYLHSLAYAHIPFLNHLITSYRSTSQDPYAFEVSEWDVPVWYIQRDSDLVHICLMPYWGSDAYPNLGSVGSTTRTAVRATTPEALQSQADEEVAPGKLELLDALSLFFRGRFGDAVRSAVTAIEVALESQLEELLKAKGNTEDQIERRLAATRNSFFDRLADYVDLSQKRLPGPLLSIVPYINGTRLRSELEWVRNLRHTVVHEGVRVDVFSRGPMLRAIETMTWLFRWLSGKDDHDPKSNRNYFYFSSIRGQITYPFKYTASGLTVVARERPDGPLKVVDEVLVDQYMSSINEKESDIELFARMSLEYLQIACGDAPPEATENPVLRERYHINHKGNQSLVFLLQFDGIMDEASLGRVASRAMAHSRLAGNGWSVLCIAHHQRHMPPELREVIDAIPASVVSIAEQCGIVLITAPDLQCLVQGGLQYGWDISQIVDLLFLPGRQGMTPPVYRTIGTYVQFYPRHSAMSIRLHDGETLKIGDTIGMRLRRGYYEQVVESMQVDHAPVTAATGPCRVGIHTRLGKADLRLGQLAFLRSFGN
jgi:hypothetical protein